MIVDLSELSTLMVGLRVLIRISPLGFALKNSAHDCLTWWLLAFRKLSN